MPWCDQLWVSESHLANICSSLYNPSLPSYHIQIFVNQNLTIFFQRIICDFLHICFTFASYFQKLLIGKMPINNWNWYRSKNLAKLQVWYKNCTNNVMHKMWTVNLKTFECKNAKRYICNKNSLRTVNTGNDHKGWLADNPQESDEIPMINFNRNPVFQ